MFRDEAAILAYEAKRRPELAALLDRIDTVTDAEIEASGLPKNLRVAVTKRRQRAAETALLETATGLVDAVAVVGVTPDPIGELAIWMGDDAFIGVDRGGSLLVRYQQPLWFPADGGVWIGTAFSQHVDPAILLSSVRKGTTTRTGFMEARADWANGLAGVDCAVIDLTGSSEEPSDVVANLAALGVRFGR